MTRRTDRSTEREARLDDPAAQIAMRLLISYAKRAARAYAMCDGTGTPAWDEYYGLACTEEALRHVLCDYVQHGYLFIEENLRSDATHIGQGAAAVAECKRAADALEAALRKAGLNVRGKPVRTVVSCARAR